MPTDNLVCTEYRDYACPIFVTVWAQKTGQAFTTYNNELMQVFGPEIWGLLAVGVFLAIYGGAAVADEIMNNHFGM